MDSDILSALSEVIESRKKESRDESYVAALHADGLDKMSSKVTEEAAETVDAARSGDRDQVVYETADLWFHNLVLLSHFGLSHQDVLKELARRFGVSGLEEKKSRDKQDG